MQIQNYSAGLENKLLDGYFIMFCLRKLLYLTNF